MMVNEEELAIVRHELRNQVNNITINAELVKMQLESGVDVVKIVETVERILAQSQRCSDYLDELNPES